MFKKLSFKLKYNKEYKKYKITFKKILCPTIKGHLMNEIADGTVVRIVMTLCEKYDADIIECDMKDTLYASVVCIRIKTALIDNFIYEFLETTNGYIEQVKFKKY